MSDFRGVTIHPAMRSGRPTVNGFSVHFAVEGVWLEGVAAVMGEYGLTREQVLCACWYAAVYEVVDVTTGDGHGGLALRRYRGGGVWRRRWAQWALVNHDAMYRLAWDDVPDPPSEDDAS